MFSRTMNSVSLAVLLAIMALAPVALVAQVVPAAQGGSRGDSASKWDVFLGYSYLSPHGTVPTPDGHGIVTASYDSVNLGGIFSGAYYFNRYLGAQVEYGVHEWGRQVFGSDVGTNGNNDGFSTVSGGLIARYPTGRATPFAHVAAGGALVDGPYHNPYTWGPGVTVGGGLDYDTPLMHHHLGIRVVQADYEYMHANFGTGLAGGVASINAARLSAGLVFRVGEIALPTPVALAVSVSPATIYPGDPVSLTAMTANLDPKLNAIYSWSGTGVSGGGTSATVATESLAPGTYTVKAQVREGKPGKEGLKPWESASATGIFTVKAFEPPTISCSASPTAIKPDQKSMVTATGVSPQNRPLTYSYSATAGSINGNGATVSFSPAGAPIGVVAITCTVADDKGQTQSASTSVTIAAPYVPPVPHTQALCSISFAKDKQRPARVNNEAKACLDEVALDLERQPDARIVVVGTSNAKEKARTAMEQDAALRYRHVKVEDLAAERAVNTKDYLVAEKGIDAARVSVATGTADGQTVGDYLVPSGATFTADVAGTTPVDETVVKAQARKPLPARTARKRAALE